MIDGQMFPTFLYIPSSREMINPNMIVSVKVSLDPKKKGEIRGCSFNLVDGTCRTLRGWEARKSVELFVESSKMLPPEPPEEERTPEQVNRPL